MNGVSSGLIQTLEDLYRSSNACVRINEEYTDWFDICRGVEQKCVTSSWLFIQEYECELRIDELSVKCLMYADDQVILAPLACGLQEMINKMNDSVKKRGMKVNVCKTKVMLFERGESTT
ncbi:hypothetical protein EVAR_65165_1 [Eumeta japonica]|uniref:Reverse transcriptase domain-containing protein n=1 Tax=Eumeta variegata TaxID=151549 RepID=A0A4C1ZQ31_EUMVA|nr:hypothetical protein EVAR_65165_1 [Eumeta japonica]